jgi:hypothetical protein
MMGNPLTGNRGQSMSPNDLTADDKLAIQQVMKESYDRATLELKNGKYTIDAKYYDFSGIDRQEIVPILERAEVEGRNAAVGAFTKNRKQKTTKTKTKKTTTRSKPKKQSNGSGLVTRITMASITGKTKKSSFPTNKKRFI